MLSIRLLTKEELFGQAGNPPLSTIQAYGANAAASDLATITGAVSYAASKTSEGQFSTVYMTQSSQDEEVISWSPILRKHTLLATARYAAVRPVITPAEMPFTDSPETMYPLRLPNGGQIGVCQYGRYPQNYAGPHLSRHLENLLKQDKLPETGRSYTFGRDDVEEVEQLFKLKKYPEYRFEDKRYVRMMPLFKSTAHRTFNGEEVFLKKPYWFSVEPIEWLMDDSGILISKKALIAGIPLLDGDNHVYSGDFRETVLCDFLRKTFAPEAKVKIKTFEYTSWMKKHPNPTRDDLLSVPEGEDRNVINLLTEKGVDVLKKVFPSERWAKMENKAYLNDIFSTVDITNSKNMLTLRCLNTYFEKHIYEQSRKSLQTQILSGNERNR